MLALYAVVNVRSRRVLDAVDSGQSAASAREAWLAAMLIARWWRDSPDMPEELKVLVEGALPR
ncbi:hypothetical protein [Streptomyces sp. NBC_01198]|uniref:hypothetical protein n=1 Tax=Streptomyces sp. NBC_01198 TaxID=2903769 RepID=UPI002E128AF2|nr:hypothetical protein OG702_15510 [Streptomyces sp. NBC_01198]